jgi:hypothetical protein
MASARNANRSCAHVQIAGGFFVGFETGDEDVDHLLNFAEV